VPNANVPNAEDGRDESRPYVPGAAGIRLPDRDVARESAQADFVLLLQ
jgi:hypothetical protein